MTVRVVTVIGGEGEVARQLVEMLSARGVSAVTAESLSGAKPDQRLRIFLISDTIASALPLLANERHSAGARIALVATSTSSGEWAAAEQAGISTVLAVPVQEGELDEALQILFAESEPRRFDFYVESTLESMRDAVDRLIGSAVPFTDERTLRSLRMTVQEAIRNAVEHGNLGLSSGDKAALYDAGGFDAEVERRLRRAFEAGKRVHVQAQSTANGFVCTITDEGAGFNWRQLEPALESPAVDAITQPHGRGLALIRHFCDEVAYNESGNSVTLRKRFSRAPEAA